MNHHIMPSSEEQKLARARHVLTSIEKRIAHSHEHTDYDSIYVDLLAIVQYIERELTQLEGHPPRHEEH